MNATGKDDRIREDAASAPLACVEPDQQQLHLRVVESIADDMRRSVSEILPLYDQVLREMHEEAQITDYLPIFVSRRVRSILHPRL